MSRAAYVEIAGIALSSDTEMYRISCIHLQLVNFHPHVFSRPNLLLILRCLNLPLLFTPPPYTATRCPKKLIIPPDIRLMSTSPPKQIDTLANGSHDGSHFAFMIFFLRRSICSRYLRRLKKLTCEAIALRRLRESPRTRNRW